jgi:Protein of unknown function (DUF2384)
MPRNQANAVRQIQNPGSRAVLKPPKGLVETATDSRQDREERKRLSGPALRSFFLLADAWLLTVGEQIALLGHPGESTYFKYKADRDGSLSFDTLTRISLLLGIYKALHILYADEALANRWVKLPNSNALFGGKPALELMMSGIDGLYQVRRLLDGRRG